MSKRATALLQWGRCSCAAECPSILGSCCWIWPLQWGRCSCAAECQVAHQDWSIHIRFNGAAARVQRNDGTGSPMGTNSRGFNGAAARVQRNELFNPLVWIAKSLLQWGRCSCAAEWKWPAGVVYGCITCFNGAAARVQRNATTETWTSGWRRSLQWGRCSCAAEWCRVSLRTRVVSTGFNGAAARVQRNASWVVRIGSEVHIGFNGAAARVQRNASLELRLGCLVICFNGAAARVQRNAFVPSAARVFRLLASMGPLLVCSGMLALDCLLLCALACFNGAAARVQRNGGTPRSRQRATCWLQWGRCSCAAECRRS